MARELPIELQEPYKKAAKDAFVKTILMFAGAAFFGAIAFFKGDIEKGISQSLFALCLFTAVNAAWSIIKTNTAIEEAKQASTEGKRADKIAEIQRVNTERAKKPAIASFVVGLFGCLYMTLLYDTYPVGWVWFVAFIATGPAIVAARWSDAANTAISKYVNDESFGV